MVLAVLVNILDLEDDTSCNCARPLPTNLRFLKHLAEFRCSSSNDGDFQGNGWAYGILLSSLSLLLLLLFELIVWNQIAHQLLGVALISDTFTFTLSIDLFCSCVFLYYPTIGSWSRCRVLRCCSVESVSNLLQLRLTPRDVNMTIALCSDVPPTQKDNKVKDEGRRA